MRAFEESFKIDLKVFLIFFFNAITSEIFCSWWIINFEKLNLEVDILEIFTNYEQINSVQLICPRYKINYTYTNIIIYQINIKGCSDIRSEH